MKKLLLLVFTLLSLPAWADTPDENEDDVLLTTALLVPGLLNKKPFDAIYVEEKLPSTMYYDSTYSVSITMKNTGKFSWNPGEVSLVQDDNDVNWRPTNTSISTVVLPGGQYTFSFNVTPKACVIFGALNCYRTNFIWQLNKGGARFGQQTPSADLSVKVGSGSGSTQPPLDSPGYRGIVVTAPNGPPPSQTPSIGFPSYIK